MRRALLLAGAAVVLHGAPARAADPPKGAAQAEAEEVEPGAGTKRPAAPDERRLHFVFGAGGTAMGPAGAMGPNTSSTSLASAGFGVGGFIGLGLGRHVTLQAMGDWTRLLSPGACDSGCGGTTYSIGLGLTYHLAQGIAFDPWASYGLAYRASSFRIVDPSAPDSRVRQDYQGLDIARIAIGGDFYPASVFGFGPFLEVDLGTNLRRPAPLVPLPPGVSDSPRAYALFQVGVRVAFDPMRRASPAPRNQAARPLFPAF